MERKMPLPTAAELTDPNATNAQMKEHLGQLAENVASKEYAEKYTDSAVLSSLIKLSFSDLTDVGTVTNNTLTAWNRITYCPIDPNSTIDLTTQAYAVNEIIAFY